MSMTRFLKLSLLGVGTVAILTIGSLYGLFHGYFDQGRFEIKQFQPSTANQVAMVAERSDDEALGGLDYFVLIGDHLFDPAELRHAYHSNSVVFSAVSNCLTLHWDGPSRLVIRSAGPAVDRNQISSQKQRIRGIAISYENIALK